VTRAVIGNGAVYEITVKSLANSGTVLARIPAGGCRSVQTGLDNLQSTHVGGSVTYDLAPGGGEVINQVIADVETGMDASDASVYRGSNIQLYLYGGPADGWSHNIYMRFPVVSCLDRTVTSASLRFYKLGAATNTLGLWAVADDSWLESAVNGTSRPAYGSLLTTNTMPAAEGYVDIDITDYVIAETRKDAMVSLLIGETALGGDGGFSIISREGPGQGWPPLPDSPPVLAVRWSATNGLPNCATPLADHAGGMFLGPQTVSLSSATSGATIRYTLDGTVPSATNGLVYSVPLHIEHSATLRAIALAAGCNPSGVRNVTFEIYSVATQPVAAEPASGAFSGPVDVVLSTPTAGATIRFTLDGTEPTRSYGLIYKGPVNLAANTSIKAIACAAGQQPSPVATAKYYVDADSFFNRTQFPDGGTITASGQINADSGPAMLLDDSYWTNWEIQSPTGWVQFQFPGSTTFSIERYAVGAGAAGPDVCASSWILSGSSDGTNWAVLDHRSGTVFYLPGRNQYYNIASPAACQVYRLTFTNYTGGDFTSLGGFELLDLNEEAPDFVTWRDLRFTAAEVAAGLAGDRRDDDLDSIPLLLEYAHGSNPRVADRAGLSIAANIGARTISFPIKLRNDLNLHLESSENLTNWSVIASSLAGAPFAPTASVSGVTINADGTATFTVTGTASSGFYRLRVEHRP
jgi:hypothetical protein